MNLIHANNGRFELAFLAIAMMFGSLALRHTGKVRAMKSKKEYEKFFKMWKDADEDLRQGERDL